MNTYDVTTINGWHGTITATDGDIACLQMANEVVSLRLGDQELIQPCPERIEALQVAINQKQEDILATAGHGRRARFIEQKGSLQRVLDRFEEASNDTSSD